MSWISVIPTIGRSLYFCSMTQLTSISSVMAVDLLQVAQEHSCCAIQDLEQETRLLYV